MQTVQAPTASPPRQKGSSLASIAISSFSAFRSQAPQPQPQPQPATPLGLRSPPIRRKPLPADSPIVGRFPVDHFINPTTTITTTAFKETPTPTAGTSALNNTLEPPVSDEDLFVPRNLDDNPHGKTPITATAAPQPAYASPKASPVTINPPVPRNDRRASSIHPQQLSRTEALRAFGISGVHARSPTMPNMPSYTNSNAQPPELKQGLAVVTDDFMDDYSHSPERDSRSKQGNKPKSPAGGFTSFFGWNSRQPTGPESPGAAFPEHSQNPDSPHFDKPTKAKPNGLDIPAANSMSSYFNVPGTPLLSSSPQMNAHVEELERELREVSSELAASIQREMELEDEVERWKTENAGTFPDNRRTSDYYSDSGTSSIRFPITDPESKLEELDTQRRKAEQERATLKVRMAERLQDELRRRRDLEEQVQQLEDQVGDKSRTGSSVETPKVKELAMSLEDAKRRLAEERQVKENFEDLLSALREELEKYRNEADNLRDEVVPQLKARLEVLEADAADTERLVYESSRMQQEIKQLRSENESLAKARKQQLLQQQGVQAVQFQSIAEEADIAPLANMRVGLTRSNSLARSSAGINSKRGSLSRSNSVKDRSGEMSPVSAPAASNPMKELEEQRDALHKALKHLLQRQEMQQKEFQRRIREVEAERDAALNLTPRRTAFHKEVTGLRREVDALRRRADEALEQKWQCEKGLGGLRMDLDRAQQETSSLRDLLREHDITIPEIRIENEPLALDKAYNELRTTHALSLARVKQLETADADSLGAASAETERTLELLRQSISDAEAERDYAQKEAEQYRQQARALQQSEIDHLGKEQELSKELFAAATRMDELSDKIQRQLAANKSLRNRLTEAITRGEQEQRKSTEQIVQLEKRLKAAEDKVMLAQQSSEEAIARHEGEMQALKEGHTNHLRRVKSGLLSPSAFSPKLPTSPVFSSRSPRLSVTTSGPAMTFAEATKTEMLEKRVEELEKALRDADHEMEEVVGRMNLAQMEVADLQFERDEAMRQTRGLQAEIVAEREKVKALMATTSA